MAGRKRSMTRCGLAGGMGDLHRGWRRGWGTCSTAGVQGLRTAPQCKGWGGDVHHGSVQVMGGTTGTSAQRKGQGDSDHGLVQGTGGHVAGLSAGDGGMCTTAQCR